MSLPLKASLAAILAALFPRRRRPPEFGPAPRHGHSPPLTALLLTATLPDLPRSPKQSVSLAPTHWHSHSRSDQELGWTDAQYGWHYLPLYASAVHSHSFAHFRRYGPTNLSGTPPSTPGLLDNISTQRALNTSSPVSVRSTPELGNITVPRTVPTLAPPPPPPGVYGPGICSRREVRGTLSLGVG